MTAWLDDITVGEMGQLFEADVPQPTTLDAADIQEAPKSLFRIEVLREQRAEMYVYGNTEEEARTDAEAMLDEIDWWENDFTEIEFVDEATTLPKGETAFSGGPNGYWS